MRTYNKTFTRMNGKVVYVNTTAYPYAYNKTENGFINRPHTLQERLLAYMDRHGLSKAEYVKMVKAYAERNNMKKEDGYTLSYSTLCAYCNGTCVPKKDRLYMMCKAMGVTEQWLTGWAPIRSMSLVRSNAPILNASNREGRSA